MGRMMGCPGTGRMCHNFGKDNRCEGCGRWKAGFAPKKERARPRDECQVCENEVALDADGLAGHHGYKRPGIGSIVGDCFGVRHKPWPDTTALIEWRDRLLSQLRIDRKLLNKLPGQTVLTRMVEVRVTGTFKVERVPKTFNKPSSPRCTTSGAWTEADHKSYAEWSEWERAMQSSTYELESEIKAIECERDRVVKRIEKAATVIAVRKC